MVGAQPPPRLGPHRDIVTRYFPHDSSDYWIRDICGDVPPHTDPAPQAGGQHPVIYAALVSQNEQLAAWASGDIRRHLDEAREAWREGWREEAHTWLAELKGDPVRWPILAPEVKAEALRLEARLVLDADGDAAGARRLAEEARRLGPGGDKPTLWALITYREAGAEAALAALAGGEDPDSRNLRAALLIELGRAAECLAILDRVVAEGASSAETFRLRALAHFLAGDLAEARLATQRALELAPRWAAVRFAGAFVGYFSALSPLAVPRQLVPWPEPVDWALVKRDDESLARLREAATIFAQLADQPAPDEGERRSLETWHLACLGNDPGRQEEAADYCRGLLADEPAHHRAVAWAAARRWDIDLAPSRLALEAQVADASAAIPEVVTLAGLYLGADEAGRAVSLLDGARAIFGGDEAERLWVVLRAQAGTLAGGREVAVAESVVGATPESRRAGAFALTVAARETGDWQPLARYLEASVEETGDARLLLDYGTLPTDQLSWTFVADRAEWLVDAAGTADALRLAARAAHNADRFELCLRLLDGRRGLFQRGELPADLRRLRLRCQQALGILPAAIAEAEALARDEPTTAHLLDLAALQQEMGDLRALSGVARRLARQPDLTAVQALQLAGAVVPEDRALAVDLWRRATVGAIPDDAVGAAVDLGFRLGLDREVGPLMSRLTALAAEGRGDVQLFGIAEAIEALAPLRERVTGLLEAYAGGTAPVHLIVGSLNRTLADLYHRFPQEREAAPDPSRQARLFIRHGGRDPAPDVPRVAGTWRLHLDVTAILLAAHLGILDRVEAAFAPLRIPPNLLPSLRQMRAGVAPNQPARLVICQAILRLANDGALEVIPDTARPGALDDRLVGEIGEDRAALIAAARDAGGYVLDFLPLHKRDPSLEPASLPDDVGQHLVNCRAVVDALPLPEEERTRVVPVLGTEGQALPDTPTPRQGAALYCDTGPLEVLGDAELLPLVCDRFRVRVPRGELDQLRSEVEDQLHGQAVAAWLDDLLGALSRGIDAGTYERLPFRRREGREAEIPDDEPEVACLLDLLGFEAREGDIVWIDDRFLSGYPHAGTAPIVGSYEVLKGLRAVGSLDPAEYYRLLGRLRAANVYFLPVEPDEILHHLGQARVEHGQVVETGPLGILRRYVAACLLRGDLLQRPAPTAGGPNPYGETTFVLGLGRAITEALVRVWEEAADEDVARARAEWLLTSLYLDDFALVQVASLARPEHDARYLTAVGLAGLLARAMSLPWRPSPDGDSPRRRYFRWLSERVLRARFAKDPHLLAAVADVQKQLIVGVRRDTDADELRAIADASLRLLYRDLPDAIQQELARDTDFMASIGLEPHDVVVEVGAVLFDADDFWRAATEAVNGRASTIRALQPSADVTLQPYRDDRDRHLCYFDHPTAGYRATVADEDLELLLESAAAREGVLRRLQAWFDCPTEVFERAVAEIASLEESGRRIEVARAWRATSAAAHFEDLYRRLSARPRFQIDALLPPSDEGLLRHFRLGGDSGRGEEFGTALAAAARQLVDDEGLREALERLAGFPVPLPTHLLDAIAGLTPEERRVLIKQLVGSVGSPLSRLHLVRVLLHLAGDHPAYRRLARRIAADLVDAEGTASFEAFLAIVAWSDDQLGARPDSRAWPAHLRLALAWACAHRLFAILAATGAPVSFLPEVFSEQGGPIAGDWVGRDPEYREDVAHPRHLSPAVVLLGGLAYALAAGDTIRSNGDLRSLLSAHAFVMVEGQRFPEWSLLRDPTQARDGLGSFLAGDRDQRLAPLLGPDAEQFARSALRERAEWSIVRLDGESEWVAAWTQLYAILGDLPPYPDLSDQLAAALREVDFVTLSARHAPSGVTAIRAASVLALHFTDADLHQRLQDQLVAVAAALATRDGATTTGDAGGARDVAEPGQLPIMLLDAALTLAGAGAREPASVAAGLAGLVARLAEAWDEPAPLYRRVVQRLCDELPAAQTRELSVVLVRLRATEAQFPAAIGRG